RAVLAVPTRRSSDLAVPWLVLSWWQSLPRAAVAARPSVHAFGGHPSDSPSPDVTDGVADGERVIGFDDELLESGDPAPPADRGDHGRDPAQRRLLPHLGGEGRSHHRFVDEPL